MLELYHNDMSVCAAKVRTVLAEKGLEWKGIHLDLRAGDTQKPGYLKLNPNAVVPTIVHDGRVLIESTVICEYLDDRFPDPSLKPEKAFEKARMRLWTKQLDEGLHIAVGNLSMCIAFRHQHLRKTAEQLKAYFDGIPSAETRERRRKAVELGMDSPSFAPSLQRWNEAVQSMESVLTDEPWLAGSSFSLADIGYMPYMIRLEHLGLEKLWEKRPRVSRWRQRLFERASYKEGVQKWLNPKYLELFETQRPAVRQRMSTM
ncbi:MAG TPA: glutathione S-transferase family protein [Burkholderiales bacterium]|nr:glutathione S-transferase family protein [Burkholderiales bacterium]